jgi:hypothetical protein
MNLIIFDLTKTFILGVPHLFSKVDTQKKALLEKKYKILKRRIITGSMVTVAGIEGTELVKDVIKSQMILYGYKRFLLLALGPYLGIGAVALNLISQTGRIKNTAFLISQIGGMIIKNEVRLMDMGWVLVDISLFGKMVPCSEDLNYSLLHNVTINHVAKYLDKE